MESYQKDFIELALKYEALRFGEFTLKSGRLSPYFFNMGQFCDGEALARLGDCYAAAIQRANINFDGLFGPSYKGIPLACASAIALNQRYNRSVPFCFNRKEAKEYGEKGVLIGPLTGKILVIDDVITAGTAMRESFTLINNQGAQVAAIVVALDRQERGEGQLSALQEIQQQGVAAISIISFTDIMEYVSQQADFASYRAPMAAYRQQYGVNA